MAKFWGSAGESPPWDVAYSLASQRRHDATNAPSISATSTKPWNRPEARSMTGAERMRCLARTRRMSPSVSEGSTAMACA